MNTSTWRSKFSVLALVAVATCSSAGTGSAQYIETGTPPAATEEAAGGDWGNLAVALAGGSTVTTTSTITGDTYVLPSSGVEVVVADGVTVSESEEGTVEDQLIIETDDGIGAVAVLATSGQPADTLENYITGFAESMDNVVEVDVQANSDTVAGVYRVETSGLTLYMYISIDAQPVSGYMVIEVVIADAADMEASIVQMRDNVSINGIAAFAGVNEADVAGIIRSDEG